MDRPQVNFAFSPCPNDTFAFHALVHGLVPGVQVTPHLDDIEALNSRAATGAATTANPRAFMSRKPAGLAAPRSP